MLTGTHITDSSFGLRAMRSEVTGVVRLEQPQYQSAELLIAVLARGFRVAEVPATIHKRQVGESKKGHNAIYGLHYAGVVARHLVAGAAAPGAGRPGPRAGGEPGGAGQRRRAGEPGRGARPRARPAELTPAELTRRD